MKIVIEIDDARFKDIRRIACVQLENYHFKTVEQIIANGTPLPKGHGKLKDIDKIISDGISKGFCDWYDEMEYAPTIIEADKESDVKMIEVIKVEDCGENIGDYDIPIHNAIIIPQNPTNGDMIKAMFPDVKIHQSGGYTGCLFQPSVMLDDIRSEWWNAPYKRSAEKADRKEIDWISIDENVPINGQRVLVCFDDGFILIGAYMDYAEDEKEPYWVFDGEEDFNLEDSKVIGWMQLPESYKEVKE